VLATVVLMVMALETVTRTTSELVMVAETPFW
jgi:hypothetical protein